MPVAAQEGAATPARGAVQTVPLVSGTACSGTLSWNGLACVLQTQAALTACILGSSPLKASCPPPTYTTEASAVACPLSVSPGMHLQCRAGVLRASSLCAKLALSSAIPQAGVCPSARDSLGLCHVVTPQGLAGGNPEPVQRFVPKSNGRHSLGPFYLLRTPPPLEFQGSYFGEAGPDPSWVLLCSPVCVSDNPQPAGTSSLRRPLGPE